MANGTLKVSNIQTSSGSGTITLGQSGETVALGSGATATGFGGDNTPSFMAFLSSDQTLSDNTYTKVQFNTEVYDSDSAYDNSSNYRFTCPSGEAGKYLVTYQLLLYDSNANLLGCRSALYKNGSTNQEAITEGGTSSATFYNDTQNISVIVDLAASDYLEVYGRGNTTDSGTFVVNGNSSERYSYFSAYKLIGA